MDFGDLASRAYSFRCQIKHGVKRVHSSGLHKHRDSQLVSFSLQFVNLFLSKTSCNQCRIFVEYVPVQSLNFWHKINWMLQT